MRNENSGLIDLDALLGKAAEAAAPVPASSTPDQSPAPAEKTTRAAVATRIDSTSQTEAARVDPVSKRDPSSVPASSGGSTDSLGGLASASRSPRVADEESSLITSPGTPSRKARAPERGGRRGLFIGVGGAAILAAGFGALHLARSPAPPPSVTEEARAAASPPPLATPLASTSSPVAVPVPAPDEGEPAPKALPAEAASATPRGDARKPDAPANRAPAAVASAEARAVVETTLTDLPPSSAGGPVDLGSAMRNAAGDGPTVATTTTQEQPNPNARQVRPPPGQVLGAINAVLPSARACLGADDPVTTGSIVFTSEGSVTRVDLQGAKPTDDCVRDALSKARVQPFADPTFSTRVTVRP